MVIRFLSSSLYRWLVLAFTLLILLWGAVAYVQQPSLLRMVLVLLDVVAVFVALAAIVIVKVHRERQRR